MIAMSASIFPFQFSEKLMEYSICEEFQLLVLFKEPPPQEQAFQTVCGFLLSSFVLFYYHLLPSVPSLPNYGHQTTPPATLFPTSVLLRDTHCDCLCTFVL